MSFSRLTSIEQLTDENWTLIAPTTAIVEAFVGAMLRGKTFVFERLKDVVENPGAGPFWEALEESIVAPDSLLRDAALSSPYIAFRADEDKVLDKGMLHRFSWAGAPTWYLVPMDLGNVTPNEIFRTMFP